MEVKQNKSAVVRVNTCQDYKWQMAKLNRVSVLLNAYLDLLGKSYNTVQKVKSL